jgi:hypothetical protein
VITALLLAAALVSADTTDPCVMLEAAEASQIARTAMDRIRRVEARFNGVVCSYGSVTGTPKTFVEVAVFRYESRHLVDSVYAAQAAQNRSNPAVRWHRWPALGRQAFSEAVVSQGRSNVSVYLAEGRERLVLQLSAVPGDPDSISVRASEVARRAWSRWKRAVR